MSEAAVFLSFVRERDKNTIDINKNSQKDLLLKIVQEALVNPHYILKKAAELTCLNIIIIIQNYSVLFRMFFRRKAVL